jgi:GNAT superfamily N-acetyltransferase
VPLEDHGIVPENYSALLRKLQESGSDIFVHDASFDDIERDSDANRRATSKSKLQKYLRIAKSDRSTAQLENEFGPISKVNDFSDCQILAALADNAVDILVTEDNDLHRRATRFGFANRVYRVRQFLDLLTEQYSKLEGTHSFVENKACYQVNKSDPIFNTLRNDYPGFDVWWQKCCAKHRNCWVVSSESNIAGIVVYNDESSVSGHDIFGLGKVLKLCTFKVSEDYRGGRLGEQLLKQSIWYARSNNFDVVYVEAYEKQKSLLDLFAYYGFSEHSRKESQLIIAKDFRVISAEEEDYKWHRTNYPVLKSNPSSVIVVPIRPEFHRRLLPEATKLNSGTTIDMFEDQWSNQNRENFIPSTAIRKVYVCKAQMKKIEPGSRLYFYLTQSADISGSRSFTGVGIVENFLEVSSLSELQRITAKRSVYRLSELEEIFNKQGKTKVLNFIFSGVCSPMLGFSKLKELNILNGAPQSIMKLSSNAVQQLIANSEVSTNVLA